MSKTISLTRSKHDNPNQIFPMGDGFGLFVFFETYEDTHFRNGVAKKGISKQREPSKHTNQKVTREGIKGGKRS